jgi:hypothetical protein
MVELVQMPGWKAVGMLLDQNNRDVTEKRYGLVSEVVSWFKVLDLFRQIENERMIEQEPTTDDLKYHKARLAMLIAEGERLGAVIREVGLRSENSNSIKLADLEAAIEELRITHREWHEPLSEVRKAELWQGIFNDTPSRT